MIDFFSCSAQSADFEHVLERCVSAKTMHQLRALAYIRRAPFALIFLTIFSLGGMPLCIPRTDVVSDLQAAAPATPPQAVNSARMTPSAAAPAVISQSAPEEITLSGAWTALGVGGT